MTSTETTVALLTVPWGVVYIAVNVTAVSSVRRYAAQTIHWTIIASPMKLPAVFRNNAPEYSAILPTDSAGFLTSPQGRASEVLREPGQVRSVPLRHPRIS